ncbi:HAMP domain-containing sensor histidine kinase [Caballeronia sp. J97]|uniref:HAMP domain-containing sensor histidine kinase n=1 Tax=Caballeronia sp. J97 TaxID=2805429 RepID=UPI002AB31420|nr:HAMP domain-containing sensor histidine kinase [Caballeronia sp. J97]
MPRLSFSAQLTALWTLIAALCGLMAGALWLMFSSALIERVNTARQEAVSACAAAASRYDLSMPRRGETNTDLMHAVLDLVLIGAEGIEGGFWSNMPAAGGFLAYAFPTYTGSGMKRDIPEAETPLILRTLDTAARAGATRHDESSNGPDAVIVVACPVPRHADLFVWMLTRARPPLGPYGERAASILAGVLAIVVGAALFLALALRRWKRNLTRLEHALAADGDLEQSKRLDRLGEGDLDKVVDALNRYTERAHRLQRQTDELSVQLAQAERFSTIGKMAAQIAHEIRNPAAAMRLKAENALAGDGARREAALRTIIEQVARIETQLASLLALTQPVAIRATDIDIGSWIDRVVQVHLPGAQSRRIALAVDVDLASPDHPATIDAVQVARALDNLIVNALRHAPAGGHVTVSARRASSERGEVLRLEVIDDGPGVSTVEREHIFEPFVTGRPDGSGLGLAVVREIASAHGGRAWLAADADVTRFVIELPWRTY